MTEPIALLSAEPCGRAVNLDELLGLAYAIEVEAVARYAQLAAVMERRGEADTAAVFHQMCEIEKGHVDLVAQRAASLGQTLPPAADFTWRLPPELASSWDEVQHSLLLAPYRALAIAVTNEERAFALYSYLAAGAENTEVVHQAEALAREELAHAAELRVHRRRAYHRANPQARRHPGNLPETLDEFRALDAQLARQNAAAFKAIAQGLQAAGDTASARLVGALTERNAAAAGEAAGGTAAPAAVQSESPPDLLRAALKCLESTSEIYEEVITRAERDELLREAQTSLQAVVEAISALGHRLSEIEMSGNDAGT